jgi:raffinose/stachyose/melibiose transport system substrate-binding protein
MHKTSRAAVAAASLIALIGLSACAGATKTPVAPVVEDKVLRVAMGSPGEAQIKVWQDVAAQFEKTNPEWKVDLNFQKDDLYETIGLPNLLSGRNAPDVYFEWVGNRLRQRAADGYAADLTDLVNNGPLKGVLPADTYKQATEGGKILMVPHIADVTNVLFYNTTILASAGIEPPKDWPSLLSACDALSAKKIIPIASGNKDLWAAGNWLAHVVSRVVGHEEYDAALSGKSSFDSPKWTEAFQRVKELADHHCVNDSFAALDDNEGAQLFFQGKAAMHPIGSWLVSWAIDEAPKLNFDFVNLPAIPGELDPGSAIGVITGYVVNAKSSPTKQTKAAEFLALVSSTANVQRFVAADAVPVNATLSSAIDERTVRLNTLLADAPVVIRPPDTGYNLKVADALYRTLAEVLGGKTAPEQAGAALQKQVSP